MNKHKLISLVSSALLLSITAFSAQAAESEYSFKVNNNTEPYLNAQKCGVCVLGAPDDSNNFIFVHKQIIVEVPTQADVHLALQKKCENIKNEAKNDFKKEYKDQLGILMKKLDYIVLEVAVQTKQVKGSDEFKEKVLTYELTKKILSKNSTLDCKKTIASLNSMYPDAPDYNYTPTEKERRQQQDEARGYNPKNPHSIKDRAID